MGRRRSPNQLLRYQPIPLPKYDVEHGSPGIRPVSKPDRVVELTAAAMSLPDVRLGKVHALKGRIEDGKYRVSPEQVATAMLDQMREPHKR